MIMVFKAIQDWDRGRTSGVVYMLKKQTSTGRRRDVAKRLQETQVTGGEDEGTRVGKEQGRG